MSTKPSLQTLIDRAKASIIQKTKAQNPATDAIAAALGGGTYSLYAYQDYLAKQQHPSSCDEDWLYVWGARLKVTRVQGTYATGTVVFSGLTNIVSIPAETIIKTQSGVEYEVTAETQSDQPVPVQCLSSGTTGNIAAGVSLFLVTAVTGLDPDSITSNDISGGTDIEDISHYRTRVEAAYNERYAVGRPEDYKIWAISSHPDVDFAKVADCFPDAGNVTVYIGQKENDPVLTDGVKDAAQIFIDSQRIGGVIVYVLHISTNSLSVTLADVSDVTTRQSIEQALQTYINDRMGDDDPITPGQLVIEISKITETFSLISPTTSVTPAKSEVITFGGVTWQ
ncbi:baseplate J/gp47 family protein [Hydrogenovibrio marinus]|uniref:Baseplate protein J-like barrel domain-containing protein n=1 Tax=Hydrogenovibrio marinus TaxID=28885 RepID=A0A066ZWW3_HYDMR|nr:baseplate J/gp47 family protein [Hydrogenovibrio marinus]KDN94846.1 hypothetical protein EI16_00590 [Hydrogenovibrio marinus]BBN59306.1 hypothetical protein HVMH_0900 [Hydrogenovibrio marinus]